MGISFVLRATGSLALLVCLISPAVAVPPAATAATTPCVAGNPTLADLELAAGGDYEGPLATKYRTDPFLVSELALECYGRRTLRFTAYVPVLPAIGWEYLYGVKPAWFRGAESWIFVASAARDDPATGPTALAGGPPLRGLQGAWQGHWVLITGHFDDPRARTCTAKGVKGRTPTRAEMVRICRSTFVVTRVSAASAPATTTIPGVDVVAAPAAGAGWIALAALLGGALGLFRLRRRR